MKTDYIARRPDPSVAIDKDRISQLAFDCNSYPVLVYALLCRGFKEEEIKDLLTSESPGGKILSFPLNMTHMASAIILRHLQLGNKIGIFADYDCDGITSGYVMKTGLEQIKNHIGSQSIIALHYPQRADGYGLNNDYCHKAAEAGIKLIVTVDNGVATKEQCDLLSSLGVELVVTDHHEANKLTKPNTIIVDPCVSDVSRSYLAGVAVAYNTVLATAARVELELDDDIYMPAVMLGTISDCMPMTYENACYIKRGLNAVNAGKSPFFSTMREKDKAVLDYTPVDISFNIAPKVNAASRMGDTRLGAAGLFLSDTTKIETVIEQLCELNDKRKECTNEAKEAVVKIADNGKKLIAFNGKGYQKGIHGIIAGEITKKFPDYPAFVYCVVDGICKGSVRCNNNGIDAMDMFRQLKSMGYLESCAGHANACVITVKEDKLDAFVDEFTKLYDSMAIPPVVVQYDAAASLKSLSNDVLVKMSEIPFTAQEQPLFLVKNVMVNSIKASKSNPQNIQFTLADNTAVKRVWGWGMADEYERKGSPKEVHLVCSLTQDFMRKNTPTATLRIVDMIPVA